MRVLETAFEAHGGEAALARAQQLILEMEGTLDRGARHQGPLPQSNRPTTYREWLVIDEAAKRVGHQQYYERYDGAIESWRFVYIGDDRMQFSSPVDMIAVDVRESQAGEKRK